MSAYRLPAPRHQLRVREDDAPPYDPPPQPRLVPRDPRDAELERLHAEVQAAARQAWVIRSLTERLGRLRARPRAR